MEDREVSHWAISMRVPCTSSSSRWNVPHQVFAPQILDEIPLGVGRVREVINLPAEEVVEQPRAVAHRAGDEELMRILKIKAIEGVGLRLCEFFQIRTKDRIGRGAEILTHSPQGDRSRQRRC